MNNDILFFKIWHNKYLRLYILNSIKETTDSSNGCRVNLKSKILAIGSRIEYNKIQSLEWMIKYGEYGMIKDKIGSGHYVHINLKSIRLLIVNCKLFEIYELLFKHRKNDMERLDLIEESVRLDSVFALKSFIQLYGGIDLVANTIINPKVKKQQQASSSDKGNGEGGILSKLKNYALSFSPSSGNNNGDNISEYTSLIDIALSYASSNVFDYLFSLKGLNWYTESKFIYNTISHKRDYFIQPISNFKRRSKLNSANSNSDSTIITNTINSQYSTLESIASVKFNYNSSQHDKLTRQEYFIIEDQLPPNQQQLKQYQNIKRSKIISAIILDNLTTITSTSTTTNATTSTSTLGATKKRDFIDKVFNKSIENLVNQHNQQQQQNDIEPNQNIIVSIIDLVLTNCMQGESLDYFFIKSSISIIPFLKNYKDHSNYIMYLILSHYKLDSPIFNSSLLLLKNGQQQSHSTKIQQLLNKCIETPFPLFYIYYVDFHFHESNFREILNIKSKLTLDAINHLWVLSILNFSIDGLNCYKKLIETTTFETLRPQLFSASSGNISSNWLIEFHVGKYLSINSGNIQDDEDGDGDEKRDFKITFMNVLLNCSTDIKVPWAFLFEILFDFYPTNQIEPFIKEFPIVERKFIEWINSFTTGSKTFYPSIFNAPIESNGEISIDKLDLFFKYNSQQLLSIKLVVPQIIETISTVGKIKFINYLIRQKPVSLIQNLYNENGEIFSTIQVISLLLFKLFGTTTTTPSLKESIEIYKLLDHKEIEKIIQTNYSQTVKGSFYYIDQNQFDSHTLEDCLFSQILMDSIFGNGISSDGNSGVDENCIKILSLLNGDSEILVGKLSVMKLVTVQDKIEFIKFIYSNKLVSSFGCSFSLLLIGRLIKEIEIQYSGVIFIIYEKELVQLVKIMNGLSKFCDQTTFYLLKITLGKRMNRLFNQLIILSNASGSSGITIKNPTLFNYENEYEEMMDSFQVDLEYNRVVAEINWENTNGLLSTNDFKSKFLLFINGNIQSLIGSFKNQDKSFYQNTSVPHRAAFILEILKLSIQYFDFKNWIQLFNSVVQNHYKEILNFELQLFKLVYKFNRLDILAYLLEPEFIEPDKSILEIPFIKGYYPIVEFLIKRKPHLLLSTTIYENTTTTTAVLPISTSIVSDAGLDSIFNLSLINGHCAISNLLVETYKGYFFTFSISNILESGYSNILKFIIKSNLSIKELHFYTIGEYYKTGDTTFLKKLIQQIEKFNNLSKSQKIPNYQNRILLFKDTLKQTSISLLK